MASCGTHTHTCSDPLDDVDTNRKMDEETKPEISIPTIFCLKIYINLVVVPEKDVGSEYTPSSLDSIHEPVSFHINMSVFQVASNLRVAPSSSWVVP